MDRSWGQQQGGEVGVCDAAELQIKQFKRRPCYLPLTVTEHKLIFPILGIPLQ